MTDLVAARVALCERLVKYSDDIHCIAVHRDLANDLREAEALISLLAEEPDLVRAPAQTVRVTDKMVNAAARVIWNDSHARMGGSWALRDPNEVVVVQTLATARAALNAAIASQPPAAPVETATSSDDGVEVRHAEAGNTPGSVPGEEMSSSATRLARTTVQGAAAQPCAGVTSGSSDPRLSAGNGGEK